MRLAGGQCSPHEPTSGLCRLGLVLPRLTFPTPFLCVRSEVDWDIFWADTGWVHEILNRTHLQDHQRVNHFQNHYELTRKDLMVKNLKRAKKQKERESGAENSSNGNGNTPRSASATANGHGSKSDANAFEFFPQTYVLPAEYGLFVEEFKRTAGVWIMKPIGRAQGKGIFLFTKLSQISDWRKGCK